MSEATFATREEAFEAAENKPVNDQIERSIGNVIVQRFSRRDMFKGHWPCP